MNMSAWWKDWPTEARILRAVMTTLTSGVGVDTALSQLVCMASDMQKSQAWAASILQLGHAVGWCLFVYRACHCHQHHCISIMAMMLIELS